MEKWGIKGYEKMHVYNIYMYVCKYMLKNIFKKFKMRLKTLAKYKIVLILV